LLSEALAEKLECDRLDDVLAAMDSELGPIDDEARAWARRALWG